MSAVITALLALLGQLVPAIGSNSSLIATILNALIQIVPLVVKEAEDVLPEVKNIISALSTSPAATADQLATLATLDAQVDAAFEAAVAAQQGATA